MEKPLKGAALAINEIRAEARENERFRRKLRKLPPLLDKMKQMILIILDEDEPTDDDEDDEPVNGENLGPLIIEALTESDTPLSVGQIAERVKKKGWKTTSSNFDNVVGQYVYRFRQEGLLTRVRRGRYTLGKRAQ